MRPPLWHLCTLLLALAMGTGLMLGCDEEHAAEEARKEAAPTSPLSKLFEDQGTHVALVGPLREIDFGTTRDEVLGSHPDLLSREGMALAVYPEATFSVKLGRDDRVHEAVLELPRTRALELVTEAWGEPWARVQESHVWRDPRAGLLASLTFRRGNGPAELAFRRFSPLLQVLGEGAEGMAPLANLGETRAELSTHLELSDEPTNEQDPRATFRVPETEYRGREGEMPVYLHFTGEGEDAALVALSLRVKVPNDDTSSALGNDLRAAFGEPRVEEDGRLVYQGRTRRIRARQDRGVWRLEVDALLPLEEMLRSDGVHLFGPAEPLHIGISATQARKVAPVLFATPGGYRPPELPGLQFKARMDARQKLAEVSVYAPYAETVAALETRWGEPRWTGEREDDRRAWWHNPSTSLRCMMERAPKGTRLELVEYMPTSRLAVLLLEWAPRVNRDLHPAEMSQALPGRDLTAREERATRLELELPPTEVEFGTIQLDATVRSGIVRSLSLTLPRHTDPNLAATLSEVFTSRYGRPSEARRRPTVREYTWPGGLSILDDGDLKRVHIRLRGR